MVPLHKLRLVPTEQDILKHETATGAQGLSSGTFQQPGKKSQYQYKMYDRKDPKQPGYFSNPACLAQFSEVRGRGPGVPATLLLPGFQVVTSSLSEIIIVQTLKFSYLYIYS